MWSSVPSVHACVAVLVIFFAAFSNVYSGQKRHFGRLSLLGSQNNDTEKVKDGGSMSYSSQDAAGSGGKGNHNESVLRETSLNGTDFAFSDFHTNVSSVSQRENVTDPTLELVGTNASFVSGRGNLTDSTLEPFGTDASSVLQSEIITNSTLELFGTDASSVLQSEIITNSTLELFGTNSSSVSQSEEMTNSTLELFGTNSSSVSQGEEMTNSTLELFGTNSSSVSRGEEMTNSTLELFSTNSSSVSQSEEMTNSSLELFGTNSSSVSQGEEITNSSLELFDTDASSVSGRENITDPTLNMLNQKDSLTRTSEKNHTQITESFSGSNNSHTTDTKSNSSKADARNNNTNAGTTSQTPDKNSFNNAVDPDSMHDSLAYYDVDYVDYDDNSSISIHSSSDDNNTNLNPSVGAGCVTCQKRSIDRRFRIQQFKNQILKRLHMTNLPNTTGVPVPKFPALVHLYDMDADLMTDSLRKQGQGHVEYEDDIIVKTERVFIPAKQAPLALHLNLTDTVYFPPAVQFFTSEIRSAYLWFYIHKHHTPPSYVIIESILPHNKPGRTFAGKRVLTIKLAKEKAFGWKKVDIRDTLRQWVKHPMTNLGLVIKVEDAAGKNLIVLPPATDVDKGYEPWLDTRVIEPRHSVRRRRSESLMCVENSTDTRCCRHPLLVGFAEFGWDWIIAPTHVNADYCTGECRMTMQDHTPHSWVNQQVTGLNSCCTPTKLSPLPLLYFDESMNVIYQILQDMKVERCGCA